MWDLVGNPEERFSQNEAHFIIILTTITGLRVLSGSNAIALLDEIERVLSYTGFLTLEDHVRVLSGEEEGVFAWVAANYLKGFFWTDK